MPRRYWQRRRICSISGTLISKTGGQLPAGCGLQIRGIGYLPKSTFSGDSLSECFMLSTAWPVISSASDCRPASSGLSGVWKPDFSATSKLSNTPKQAVRLRVLVVAAGDEQPLRHERLLAVREPVGDFVDRVQPRVAERVDLPQQHGGLGQTDLHDPLAFAAAGEHPFAAIGLGQHDLLLGLAARAAQRRLGDDDRLLGLLAGAGQVRLALVLGDAGPAPARW